MKKIELTNLIENIVRNLLTESGNIEVVQLCKQYYDLENDYLDFDQLMEFDQPIDYINKYVYNGDDSLWNAYLVKVKKVKEYSKTDIRNFVRQPEIKNQIIKFLKKQDIKIQKKQNDIFKELVIKYPVLQILDKQLSYNSPIEGTDIYKYGNNWSITTPGYYNDDIKLTSDEAKQYKQFLKDKGIVKKRIEKKYSYPMYDNVNKTSIIEADNKENRYTATIQFYVYTDNDSKAIIETDKIISELNKKYDNNTQLVHIYENKFGALKSRKVK